MRPPTRTPGTPRFWVLYLGGFLGPFGGSLPTAMLPEIRDALHTDLQTVAASISAYLFPFAVAMLFSGTLGEKWGRRRTVRGAYLLYAAASLLCAAATSAPAFMAGRALQGIGNAFTSPLLLAAISELVTAEHLGAKLGWFASFQAAGQAFAPIVGGLAAGVDYRLAYLVSALAALALATTPPPDAAGSPLTPTAPQARRPATGTPARAWQALLNRRLAVACAVAFCLHLVTTAMMVLVGLHLSDRFGLAPQPRGLVIAAFGAAGLATGMLVGRLVDRFGLRPVAIGCFASFSAAVAVQGVLPTPLLVALAVAVCGAAATGGRISVNSLSVSSTPANKGGAASMAMAWQFFGSSMAPLLVVPAYRFGAGAAYLMFAAVLWPAIALLTRAPMPERADPPRTEANPPSGEVFSRPGARRSPRRDG